MKFIEITTGYPKASTLLPKEDFYRYPCEIAQELGLTPEIWCVRGSGQQSTEKVHGIMVRRFSSTLHLYFALWNSDIALIHAWLRPHLPSLLAGLTPKPKVFTTLTYELGSSWLAKTISLFLVKRFDKVISITPYEQDIYARQGIPSDLVPLAIDYDFFSQSKKKHAVALKYHLRASSFRIVTVANFRAFKNLDIMVDAFDRFTKRWKDAQFIVIGQDMLQNQAYREQKKTRATVKDIIAKNKNILWVGHQTPHEIRDLLGISDIYVSSSSVEAQGLTNYEAAASGLPLCLSEIGSFTSVFSDAALFHPPGDAKKLAENFYRYAKSEALRKKKGSKAKEIMKRYDFDSIGKRLIKIYRELLKHA